MNGTVHIVVDRVGIETPLSNTNRLTGASHRIIEKLWNEMRYNETHKFHKR